MPKGYVELITVSPTASPSAFSILTFANKSELSTPQISYSSTWILQVLVADACVAVAVLEGAGGSEVPSNSVHRLGSGVALEMLGLLGATKDVGSTMVKLTGG